MAESGTQTPMTQRIAFVDTARGIAMLCIVLGHLGLAPVNYVVFTFHVPIFYLITGWFLSRRLGMGAFARKRARTLLVPYAVTCLVIIAGKTIGALIAGGLREGAIAAVWWTVAALYAVGGPGLPVPQQVSNIGAIWFLWASFWGCVGLRALLALKREWLRALIALAVALAGVFTAKVFFLPLDLQPGAVALAYMYLGYLARTYAWPRVQAWPRGAKVGAAVACGVVWVAYILWRDRVVFMDASPGQHWWSVFGILAACVSVLIISWLVTRGLPRLGRSLGFLGKYSLIMLCVHITEMWFIDYTALANALMGAGVPYLVAGGLCVALKLTIIIVATYLLAKWNPSRRVFGFPPLHRAAE